MVNLSRTRKMRLALCFGVVSCLVLSACGGDMSNQPRYKPLGPSDFFADGRASRPALEGTVARGELRLDEALYTGKEGGVLIPRVPVPVTRELLERGRERFDIFCSPCHGRLGEGDGMVVQRGFRPPPSFHLDRMREVQDGHLYDVITNGFGGMASYASRIGPTDRWAIVAYLRALQLSQASTLDDVPPEERRRLQEMQR